MNKKRDTETPFAKNLQALLKEQQMGVREAARIAGVSPSTITNWTSGVAPDNYMAVKKLAKELGVSFSFLLTGEDDARTEIGPPSIHEVFEEGDDIFDGIAKITITRLIPRSKK